MKWRWLFIQLIYKSQIASMEKYWYNLNSKSSGFWLVHLCHISNYDNNCIYKHLECLQFILVGWLCKIDKFIIHLLKMTFFNKIVWLVFIWPFKCFYFAFFYHFSIYLISTSRQTGPFLAFSTVFTNKHYEHHHHHYH